MTHGIGPVRDAERIVFLDILRGFAVLGILAMNIQSFSMPGVAYFNPFAWGDVTGTNKLVWWLANTFANQKFMTLFSMLFGAGVVLMFERAEAAGRGFAGLHYRRMLWLLLFGLAHGYLLWSGDILAAYAISGLVVFLFRRRRPGTLLTSAVVFLVIGSSLLLMSGLTADQWPPEELAEFQADFQPTEARLAEEVAAFRGTWGEAFDWRLDKSLEMQIFVIPFYTFWRATAAMLLGMALFKWGVITGRAPTSRYWLLLALALLIGLPATLYGSHRQLASGWDPVPAFFLHSQWGYWSSMLMAMGWLSALLLFVRTGLLPALHARLAACGRMAFTNYILTTVICTLIFYGHGLGLFGKVSRIGQASITVVVWLVLLAISPLWLARFRYGPLEWLWRSLSYSRRQPWRHVAP